MVSSDTASPTTATLAEQVLLQLQEAIVKGRLKPGQKISETELSQHFGVSRGPLREAIRRLEGQGLVVKKPHVGISVAALSADELFNIYDLREALEGMACKLAAQHMTQPEIDALKALLDNHQEAEELRQGAAYYQSEGDFDFHYRIVLGSHNARLQQMLCGELYHLIRMYRYRLSTTQGRAPRAFDEHRQILQAIEEGDDEFAEVLMRHHIRASRRNIKRHIEHHPLLP